MHASIKKHLISFYNFFGFATEKFKRLFSFQMSPRATEHRVASSMLPASCGLRGPGVQLLCIVLVSGSCFLLQISALDVLVCSVRISGSVLLHRYIGQYFIMKQITHLNFINYSHMAVGVSNDSHAIVNCTQLFTDEYRWIRFQLLFVMKFVAFLCRVAHTEC